jgi:hypothetical protein
MSGKCVQGQPTVNLRIDFFSTPSTASSYLATFRTISVKLKKASNAKPKTYLLVECDC